MVFFFFNDTATTEIYTLSLHDALPIFRLPIDRVFTLKGFGTVVTGTALSGSLSADAQVEIGRAHV